MSFQAYIDNIKANTGKTPEELKKAMEQAGLFSPDMKASVLVEFLAKEFGLGHGHSMAIWAVFKEKGWVHGRA
jgi:transposase